MIFALPPLAYPYYQPFPTYPPSQHFVPHINLSDPPSKKKNRTSLIIWKQGSGDGLWPRPFTLAPSRKLGGSGLGARGEKSILLG